MNTIFKRFIKRVTEADRKIIEAEKLKNKLRREQFAPSLTHNAKLQFGLDGYEIPSQVQKILSMDQATQKQVTKTCLSNVIQKFRLHDQDTGSVEASLAAISVKLGSLYNHFDSHIHDFHVKRRISILESRRIKLLIYMRDRDLSRYFDICKRLNIAIPPKGGYKAASQRLKLENKESRIERFAKKTAETKQRLENQKIEVQKHQALKIEKEKLRVQRAEKKRKDDEKESKQHSANESEQ